MNATKLSPAKKSPDRRDARHRAQVEGGNKPIAPGSRDWIGRASRGLHLRALDAGRPFRALGPVSGKPAHRALEISRRQITASGDPVERRACVENNSADARAR